MDSILENSHAEHSYGSERNYSPVERNDDDILEWQKA